ncbi:MAG: prolipoprotein diacylglyceryl transferase, partial [Spirochaetia bacterium]|nr:prolipoprotein diacylglyceryl transferase [Spirochaetia bacterium]
MNTFLDFWQHLPLHLDPNIISLFGFQVRWYSLGWLASFLTVYFMVRQRLKNNPYYRDISLKLAEEGIFYAIFGILIGGRLGYVIFYQPGYFLEHPLEIILPFSPSGGFHITGISGLSYHGGVIGLVIAFFIFSSKKKVNLIKFFELFIPAIPLGYIFGRLGNFMNGELYGRITDVPWGMYFFDESAKDRTPFTELRHPSQLYEAFFEGLVNFLFLWFLKDRVRPGVIMALYPIGYGIVRFFIEFYRQPEAQFRDDGNELCTVIGIFSMG